MVTVAQARQQLESARSQARQQQALIEAQQYQAPTLTRQQLQTQTPMSSVQLQQQQAQQQQRFQQKKKSTLTKIKEFVESLAPYEKQISQAEAQQREAARQRSAWEAAWSGGAGNYPKGASPETKRLVDKFARQIEEQKALGERMAIREVAQKAGAPMLTMADIKKLSFNLPQEEKVKETLPWQQLTEFEKATGMSIAPLSLQKSKEDFTPTQKELSIQMPTLSQKIVRYIPGAGYVATAIQEGKRAFFGKEPWEQVKPMDFPKQVGKTAIGAVQVGYEKVLKPTAKVSYEKVIEPISHIEIPHPPHYDWEKREWIHPKPITIAQIVGATAQSAEGVQPYMEKKYEEWGVPLREEEPTTVGVPWRGTVIEGQQYYPGTKKEFYAPTLAGIQTGAVGKGAKMVPYFTSLWPFYAISEAAYAQQKFEQPEKFFSAEINKKVEKAWQDYQKQFVGGVVPELSRDEFRAEVEPFIIEEFKKQAQVEGIVAGTVGVIGGGIKLAKHYIKPSIKFGGKKFTPYQFGKYKKALAKSKEVLAAEKGALAKLRWERAQYGVGDIWTGTKVIGKGTKVMTTIEKNAIIKDLMATGVVKSKKEALKWIEDWSKSSTFMKGRIPDKLTIMGGSLGDIKKTIQLPKIPLSRQAGIGKWKYQDVFGVGGGIKSKKGVFEFGFTYRIGARGKPVGKEMIIAKTPPKSKITEVMGFGPGYKTKKNIGEFIKQTFESYVPRWKKIVKVPRVQEIKFKDVFRDIFKVKGRVYAPEWKTLPWKRQRWTPKQLKEWIRIIPSKKDLKKLWKVTPTTEKQKAGELIITIEKGKFGFDIAAVSKGRPKITYGLGAKVRGEYEEYLQLTGIRGKKVGPTLKWMGEPSKVTIKPPTPLFGPKGVYTKQVTKQVTTPSLIFTAPVTIPKPSVFVSKPITTTFPKIVGGIGGLGATSVFAAKGIYERTPSWTEIITGSGKSIEEGYEPTKAIMDFQQPKIAFTYLGTGKVYAPSTIDMSGYKEGVIIVPKTKPIVSMKTRQEIRLVPRTLPITGLRPLTGLKPMQRISTKVVPRTLMRTRAITKITPVTRPIIRVTPRVTPTTRPILRRGGWWLPKPRTKRKPPLKRAAPKPSAFEVFIKRRGKKVRVSPFALKKGEALAFGVKVVKGGAAAQFWLKPTKKKAKKLGLKVPRKILAFEFRKPIRKGKEIFAPLRFVQKRTFRISTLGEKRAIPGVARRIKWI